MYIPNENDLKMISIHKRSRNSYLNTSKGLLIGTFLFIYVDIIITALIFFMLFLFALYNAYIQDKQLFQFLNGTHELQKKLHH